jgi:hypothetical protein
MLLITEAGHPILENEGAAAKLEARTNNNSAARPHGKKLFHIAKTLLETRNGTLPKALLGTILAN